MIVIRTCQASTSLKSLCIQKAVKDLQYAVKWGKKDISKKKLFRLVELNLKSSLKK